MNQPLAETIFWIAALACAVAEIAIVRSIIAQRRAQHSNLVPSGSPVIELIWGVVPAIALAFLLFATWHRVQQRGQHMQMNHGGHEMAAAERDGGSGVRLAVSGRRVAVSGMQDAN
jgi:heme/copper-type cytochrome/quinol oxidase subunit 2